MKYHRKTIAALRQKVRQLLVPAVMILIIFYSLFQMVSSERGIIVWIDLKQQVAQMKHENHLLTEQVSRTEVDIGKLKPGSLDVDYLDEMIRRNLPKMHPDERVIFVGD